MISYQYIYFALFDTCISDYYSKYDYCGLLKDQKINNLIKNLIISITTGLVTLLIVVLFKLANGLLWAIPIQLLTFSLLPFFKKKTFQMSISRYAKQHQKALRGSKC
jgi:hypothetical protein